MSEYFTVFNVAIVFSIFLVFIVSFLLGRKLLTNETFGEIIKDLLMFLTSIITTFKFSDKK